MLLGSTLGDAKDLAQVPNNQSYIPDILDLVDGESVVDEQYEVSSDDANSLFFVYDCETTGLNIYMDQVIEIAAELLDSHDHCTKANFSSLVKTSRHIPTAGIVACYSVKIKCYKRMLHCA